MANDSIVNDTCTAREHPGRKSERPFLELPQDGVSAGSIYLMYDKKDMEEGLTLAKRLRGLCYDIHTPVFGADILLLRRYHESCLMQSDCMIILAQHSNIQWVNMKMVDIIKSPGMGRQRPIRSRMLLWHHERQSPELRHLHAFELIRYTVPEKILDQVIRYLP